MNTTPAWYARWWRWSTDAFCSHDGLPSFPKLMAIAVYWAYVAGRPLPVTVAALLVAASFGMKTFQMWLGKASFAATESGSVALKHEFTRSESRREVDETHRVLTYTETGEPATSLPAQPDARTPAGGE